MRYLSLLLVFLLSISTNAQEYFPKNDGVKQSFKNFTAITNATIYVSATQKIEKATLLIKENKIVEKILEDGLGEFVASMPEAPKTRFMQLGQQIAAQIALMVRGYKVKVRTVIHLIREWLLVIPGVNAFFLEQEAKIKTDRILEYEQQYHDAHPATP